MTVVYNVYVFLDGIPINERHTGEALGQSYVMNLVILIHTRLYAGYIIITIYACTNFI